MQYVCVYGVYYSYNVCMNIYIYTIQYTLDVGNGAPYV